MEEDKKKHFIVAFVVGLIVSVVFEPLLFLLALLGLGIIGFEVWQYITGLGTFESLDILYGFAGLGLAFFLASIIKKGNDE